MPLLPLTPFSLITTHRSQMASEADQTVFNEEELDDDDDDEESEEEEEEYHLSLPNNSIHPPQNDDVDDEEDDVEIDDESTSSSNLAPGDGDPPPPSALNEVTVAVARVPTQTIPVDSLPDPKRQRIEDVSIATVVAEKKPLPLDECRKLFQRLWTDEDEIELLQGFLEYTTQRGTNNSSHIHDTTAFYDQVKCKLQLDFNKNQLVEKLRRLKKKYRNVISKISSGKDYVFKSPHDKSTFEISRKIWSGAAASGGGVSTVAVVEEGGLDDEEGNPISYSNPNPNPNLNLIDYTINGLDTNSSEKKTPKPRKRSRGGLKIEEKHTQYSQQLTQSVPVAAAAAASVPNLIEETVKSSLSPLFKELLNINNAMNGPCCSRGFGGVTLNPVPFSFGGSLNFTGGGDIVDEKWRKQQILELEVYSKRLELVQDQIKSKLQELRSMGS